MISREKFIQQTLPRQLGALAATLGRIASCARWEKPAEVIPALMTESIKFVEWLAPHITPEAASELVDMQVMLAMWRKLWPEVQLNSTQRALLSLQAKKWSDQVLDFSGLLTEA